MDTYPVVLNPEQLQNPSINGTIGSPGRAAPCSALPPIRLRWPSPPPFRWRTRTPLPSNGTSARGRSAVGRHHMPGLEAADHTGLGPGPPQGRRAQRLTPWRLGTIAPDKVSRPGLRHLKRPLPPSASCLGGERTGAEHRRAQGTSRSAELFGHMGRLLPPPEGSLGTSPRDTQRRTTRKRCLKIPIRQRRFLIPVAHRGDCVPPYRLGSAHVCRSWWWRRRRVRVIPARCECHSHLRGGE